MRGETDTNERVSRASVKCDDGERADTDTDFALGYLGYTSGFSLSCMLFFLVSVSSPTRHADYF